MVEKSCPDGRVVAGALDFDNDAAHLLAHDFELGTGEEDGSGIPNLGRNTQGVIIMKMDEGDHVAAIAAWE